MEYALGAGKDYVSQNDQYCLNPCCNGICSRRWVCWRTRRHVLVLILVVMEYALGAKARKRLNNAFIGLNPCCNGICSRRGFDCSNHACCTKSLNPCCNGICSRRTIAETYRNLKTCLNPCCNGICSRRGAGLTIRMWLDES